MEAEFKVILACVIAIVILSTIVVGSYYYYATLEIKGYLIAFGNNETFNSYRDGSLTGIISNNANGSHSLGLFGLTPSQSASIFSSSFSGKQGGIMDFGHIKFDSKRILKLTVRMNLPTTVSLSIDDKIELGSYNGWYYVSGEKNYSIPVTISTLPMTIQAMLIIIIGSTTAIAILELGKYAQRKNKPKQLENIDEEIIGIDTDLDILTIQQDIDTLREVKVVREPKARAAARLELEVAYLKNRYTGLVSKLKQVVLDVVPGLFALILGIIAFLNNSYVTNLVTLNVQDVMTLFGLGAGVSAVKSVFDRSPTTNPATP